MDRWKDRQTDELTDWTNRWTVGQMDKLANGPKNGFILSPQKQPTNPLIKKWFIVVNECLKNIKKRLECLYDV